MSEDNYGTKRTEMNLRLQMDKIPIVREEDEDDDLANMQSPH